jgi:hypothetical protein
MRPNQQASRRGLHLGALPLSALLWAALLLASLSGCSFEGENLEDRRCINNEACWELFDETYFCRQQSGDQGGYCQQLGAIKCDRVEDNWEVSGDAACDDNIYCNGDEVCDPAADGADAFGCVTVPRELDDNIECTVDYCDEVNRVVLHDEFTNCECPSINGDSACRTLYDSPCTMEAVCNLGTLQCDVLYAEEGAACDDGVACTVDSVCNAEHACVNGAPDHTLCNDDSEDNACSGVDMCAPGDPEADAEGCVPGVPVVSDPTMDDGVACTQTSCDPDAEPAITHVPTAACECTTPADCRAANPEMACAVFRCDASTSYTCVLDETNAVLEDGASCDDGVACTANDSCAAGVCTGTPVNSFCQARGADFCDPAAESADAQGCIEN